MDRLLSFKASVLRGGVDFASCLLMEESNKSLTALSYLPSPYSYKTLVTAAGSRNV